MKAHLSLEKKNVAQGVLYGQEILELRQCLCKIGTTEADAEVWLRVAEGARRQQKRIVRTQQCCRKFVGVAVPQAWECDASGCRRDVFKVFGVGGEELCGECQVHIDDGAAARDHGVAGAQCDRGENFARAGSSGSRLCGFRTFLVPGWRGRPARFICQATENCPGRLPASMVKAKYVGAGPANTAFFYGRAARRTGPPTRRGRDCMIPRRLWPVL